MGTGSGATVSGMRLPGSTWTRTIQILFLGCWTALESTFGTFETAKEAHAQSQAHVHQVIQEHLQHEVQEIM